MIYAKQSLLFAFFVANAAFGSEHSQFSALHLMQDLDGKDYKIVVDKITNNSSSTKIDQILKFGKRNLEWLDHLNSVRTDKLSFSSPHTMPSYPIESPSIYNESIIVNNYEELLEQLPKEIKNVLFDDSPYPDDIPMPLEAYLHYGILIDYVYRDAARLKFMLPSIELLKLKRVNDVRAFYILEKMFDLKEKLHSLSSLSKDEQSKIKNLLIGICYNTEKDDNICQRNLDESITSNQGNATNFFNIYIENSRELYNSFFVISESARRNDIVWSAKNPMLAKVPFLNVSDVQKYFLHNIELEWQWNGWQLELDYVQTGNVPHLEFQPGITAHVDALGGNKIFLDSNLPLSEWNNQWTIRHEFGHILGFPDCYIEFYDESLNAFVKYQLDVTNLMCSRTGHFKEAHFLEMKKNYFN